MAKHKVRQLTKVEAVSAQPNQGDPTGPRSCSEPPKPLTLHFKPKTDAQQQAFDLWPRSRILFLLGPAGVGKTACGVALALAEVLSWQRDAGRRKPKLYLTRPMVPCDEEIGLLPGTVEEKIGPWLAPFADVLGEMTFAAWDDVKRQIDVEAVPVGMLRGRTVSNGILIADECQSLTPNQVKCLLTRVGRNGRLVICADPEQSDVYADPETVPVLTAARKLADLDSVSAVHFTRADCVRDPLVSLVLDRLD